MGMKNIKLIATDIDGTLLDSSGKISIENNEAISAAMERGIAVTLSTGRMFASSKGFAAALGITAPLICYNGAMIRRPDGEILYHAPLDMDTARRMLSLCAAKGLYVQSYVNDELSVENLSDDEYRYYLETFGITGKPIGSALYSPETPPTKLLVMTETAEELKDEFQELFGHEAYVTTSNYNFIEMMNLNVNKGRALKTLADGMGISMSEVLAVGDGDNDFEMVTMAGVGVAMDNGCARLKDGAAHIAPSNDKSGLAWAINEFALK